MTTSNNNEFCRQVCENLGVALIAADAALAVRIWNHAAARMFGAETHQMLGTNMKSVFPIAVREQAAACLNRALEEGDISSLEFEHRDEHGDRRELIATFSPVVCDNGARIGASASIRDITHRIALQRELDESRKMAALGELAGAVAHHFNNLLGGLVTSNDFAAQSGDPAIMLRVLKQSGQSLLKTSRLVNGLTAFAQGNQHADDLSDLTEIVLGVAEGLERELETSNIDFQLDLPAFPVIPVGRAQLTTIIRNIARNSIEAMPKGGILSIQCRYEEQVAVVDINDTGCGLNEEACCRVFEPFWSTKATARDHPGTVVGLGLSIAHGLAQVIGASIQVSSTPGKGTQFRIRIPVSTAVGPP